MSSIQWIELSESLAFLGNSLLDPMSKNSAIGLDPEFWKAFPTFGNESVACACTALETFAQSNAGDERSINMEFTRLFVGPNKLGAAPWETAYQEGNDGTMFGAPTHKMRSELRNAGVKLENSNRQYEDHMGIELLLAAILCGRVAGNETVAQEEAAKSATSYIRRHPASWIASFKSAIAEAAPNGYYVRLVGLAESLLELVL